MNRPHLFSFLVGLGAVGFGLLALLWAVRLLPTPLTAGLVPVILIFLGIAGLAMARITPATRTRKEKPTCPN